MINEFDQVALTIDLLEEGFVVGDVGTVVDITTNGKGVTLEFFNFAGKTVAVVPMSIDDVRPLSSDEVVHARAVKTA